MVRGAAPFLLGHDEGSFGAQLDLLQGVGEVGLGDGLLLAFDREQGGLVGEVGEFGAGHAGGGAGDLDEVDVLGQGDLAGVDAEDGLAATAVGRVHVDDAVEAAGPGEGGVEDVGAVGGGDDDDALGAGEAVHLGEDLVERLLAFVVPAHAGAGAAGAPDGVDLVDEDDGGCDLAGLREQFAYP